MVVHVVANTLLSSVQGASDNGRDVTLSQHPIDLNLFFLGKRGSAWHDCWPVSVLDALCFDVTCFKSCKGYIYVTGWQINFC